MRNRATSRNVFQRGGAVGPVAEHPRNGQPTPRELPYRGKSARAEFGTAGPWTC